MGSKGSATQTQAQQGTSTYTPNSQILGSGSQALGMASQAAQSPFQAPVAPVAGFSQDQNQAFQQTRDQQGIAQPYYNQAQGLFNQSAAPISAAQTNNYLNPYAGYVMQNLQEQQGQQMHDLTGKATQQAGGVGADRIGVAQGELARQQSLASGQTLSGIYGSALSAAQQDAQRQQSAAYGIGNLGGAAQNAAMQGTSALYGMGSQQQQLSQAQMNAPYQNQLAQIAFPYQNAQYLAGITGGLAGAMGGTTYSNQNSQGTSTPAQPSIWSQLLGGATGAAGLYGATGGFGGMFGGSPSYGGGSAFSGDAYGGSSQNPLPGLDASDYGPGFASGGDTSGMPSWMEADPTIPDIAMRPTQVNQPKVQFAPMQQASGSGGGGGGGFGDILGTAAKILPMFLAQGGAVGTTPYQAYADGGETSDYIPQDFEGRFRDAATMGQIDRPRFAENPTMGEMPRGVALAHYLRDPSASAARNDSPVGSASPVVNPDQPYRMPDQASVDNWRKDNPVVVPPPATDSAVPEAATPTEGSAYPAFGGSRAASDTAAANMKAMQGATYDAPYKDVDKTGDSTSRDFARSPWTALMNAGFGMMAGTSPYAGVNIGKGLQQGVETLNKQREADREDINVNQRAKQLAMQADQHLRQYTQLTPAAAATIENQKKQRELQETQIEAAGWQKGAENLLTGDTTYINPRTMESGVLKRDGTWIKGGAGAGPVTPSSPGSPPAVAGPSAAIAPTPPGAAPAAPPAPYGVPELASNLEAPKSEIGYIGKGSPLGVASTKDLQTTITAQNKAAQSLPALEQDLAAMKLSYKTLTKDADKDGFLSQLALQPGASFVDRLERAKQANALAVAAGNKPPFDPDKVAAAENINKIQNRMGLTFSSQISPREAFAGQKIGIESSPGLTNSPKGFQRLIAGFEAAASNTRDEQTFFQNYLKKNGTSLGWRQAFEQQNPSDRYVVKGLIGMLPEPLQKGLPEAVNQLRSDPKKYKPIFDKYYNDTSDYFLKGS